MASKISPNLKAVVGADTSGFTKGMDTAKRELRAFEKAGTNAFSGMASAIGIDTQQMQRMVEVFNGASRSLSAMGAEGTKALGNIATAAKGVAGVIAGVGIVAATVAFKQLNSEAESFKNTIEGANVALQTQAYINAYRQAMHDANVDIGKSAAEAQSGWKKFWATLPGRLSTTIGGPAGTATAMATTGAYMQQQQAPLLSQAKEIYDSAVSSAEKVEGWTRQIYDLQIQQLDKQREWADTELEIAALRNTVYDTTASIEERQAALALLEEKITRLRKEQAGLQEQISGLTDNIVNETASSKDEIAAANQLYVQSRQTLASMENELRSLHRVSKSITKEAQAEALARQETADAIAKGVQRLQEYATAQIEMAVSPESVATLRQFLSTALATKPVEVPLQINTEEAQNAVLDLNDVIQQTMVEGIEGIAESIGTLLGNLMTGEGGIADFGNNMLEVVGTFAQKFGKVLVAFGVAVEAFKASTASFNGIGAIIAGAALITAGAIVKTVASNMAASMGGAASQSSYVASSATSGYNDFPNRTLKIEVTGTLVGNGSQLTAVLNNEANTQYYTT